MTMKRGLLWFDADPKRDLAEKIGRAVKKYKQKHGESPNVCYVHPSALSDNDKLKTVDGVRVSSRRSVLLHHFWIGREEKRSQMKQFRFDYTVPHNAFPAFCDVRIYDREDVQIVGLTEVTGNTGMSVTNAFEYIVEQLVEAHGLDADRITWIEHYPDRHPIGQEDNSMFDEGFSIVTVGSSVHWKYATRQDVEELIGEPF
ncbi:MAG: hypothetical protein GY832_44515 [Chloroflexi bacterium]|nr:hypothetical protein [Chloroflexota bacterium]